jgi:hypothetical protein
MRTNQWEIVILKPAPVFLSFLRAQLPDVELPDLRLLQTDNTAYVIKKQKNDEDTLDEIEYHFATMFRHEISRWLGPNAHNKIEGSFLDFLCCFKFELHSHIVLMEPSISQGKQLLSIKPRSVLLKWMKSAVEEQNDLANVLERVSLAQLTENATVVVKNFKKFTDIKSFLKNYYLPILEAEMLRMCNKTEEWPAIESYQTFSQYFAVNIHSQLIHLC